MSGERPAHADLSVRVQPRARRSEVVAERDGVVVVRVTAPPAEGRANAEVCRVLAAAAGVPKSRVEVLRGHRSRDKIVRLHGVSGAALRAALGLE
jgi:uncharacterized protein (TIGR00251 family)